MAVVKETIRFHPTSEEELMAGVWELLENPRVRRAFVLGCIDLFGWCDSYARANARISQWKSGDGNYRYPLVAILLLIRISGSASFLDVALAEEAKAQRALRAQDDRYGPLRTGMRKVEPGSRKARETA